MIKKFKTHKYLLKTTSNIAMCEFFTTESGAIEIVTLHGIEIIERPILGKSKQKLNREKNQ